MGSIVGRGWKIPIIQTHQSRTLSVITIDLNCAGIPYTLLSNSVHSAHTIISNIDLLLLTIFTQNYIHKPTKCFKTKIRKDFCECLRYEKCQAGLELLVQIGRQHVQCKCCQVFRPTQSPIQCPHGPQSTKTLEKVWIRRSSLKTIDGSRAMVSSLTQVLFGQSTPGLADSLCCAHNLLVRATHVLCAFAFLQPISNPRRL